MADAVTVSHPSAFPGWLLDGSCTANVSLVQATRRVIYFLSHDRINCRDLLIAVSPNTLISSSFIFFYCPILRSWRGRQERYGAALAAVSVSAMEPRATGIWPAARRAPMRAVAGQQACSVDVSSMIKRTSR
jgi:hypothetical protein